MRKTIRAAAMLVVSAFLFWLGAQVYQHQSSSAFELSIGLWHFALCHWVMWPDLKEQSK